MALEVLAVASEIYPFVKTGGLADVVGALPRAFSRDSVAVTTLVPGYSALKRAINSAETVLEIPDLFGGDVRLLGTRVADTDLLVIDAPHLFDREGNLYTGADGTDWPDNAFRFGALSWVAARVGLGAVPAYIPDIIHVHDWQGGLALAYLAYAAVPRPRTLFTVHNLSFQGQFQAELLQPLRLPEAAFSIDGIEAYGMINFLKAGLQFADRITTVSPTYAQEIQNADQGCGLDGLLRARAGILRGIRNGIDTAVWNPETDPRIVSRFSLANLSSRSPNKASLQRRFGLEENADRLLFGVVSRLAWQKGLDLLLAAVPKFVALGAQLAILGSGDAGLEERFTSLAQTHPDTFGCFVGYDENLAHLIQAGADVILVPSRFEPCGLTQLCAMRYGAIPLVAKVGGLADTITDLTEAPTGGLPTGIQFYPVEQKGLEVALERAAALWTDKDGWRTIQANAMGRDVSWTEPANQYLQLYRELALHKN